MAINPVVPQYGAVQPLTQGSPVAVVDVDMNAVNSTNPTVTTARALGVYVLGGGAGGGAATIANGADVAQGSTTDAAYTDVTGAASGTIIGLLKGWFKLFAARFTTNGYNNLLVSSDPTTSFSDPFDGGVVDVTNSWTIQAVTGTVTQASGKLAVASSTTGSAYASIFSKNSFAPNSIAPQLVAFTIQVESPVLANVRRFWGMGTVPATPTTAIPITDGFGFELTETGVFRAVVYAASAVAASVNLTAPVDANQHGYGIIYRADSIFFYVDSITAPVAVIPFVAPNQTVLPIAIVGVNGVTPPAAGQSFIISAVGLGDYGKNTNQISDGLFPWRKATVKAPSTAAVSTDSPLVVALHPLMSLSPGTGAANLGKAEDAASASGDTGVFTLAVRRDTLTVSASATGDYNEQAVDQYGSMQVRDYEKQARTYSASANIAAAASATDIAILPGSATTTVFVTKVIISGIQTTGGLADVLLIKRSTANTGGTSAAMTPIPHDANDAAAVAAPLSYTANPTPGTAVGTFRRGYTPVGAATAVVNPLIVFDFGDKGRPITLRGIAQGLAVNLNGVTLTGGTFDVVFEWFEI